MQFSFVHQSLFAARQHADYARQNRRMPLTTSTECQKSRMPSDENIKAADEIFNVKHQLTDNTYKTIMDLLYGKKDTTTPDFDRAKFVRLKRHLFTYHQKYKKKNGRSIPLEYDTKNMEIHIETLLLAVDDSMTPIHFDDKTISRQWLQDELYVTYTKTCSCGACHYRFPGTTSGPSYMFWKPVELEFFY